MTRRLISSGSTFEAEIGYSRAVVDGDWVFVSGCTGFDYQTMTIADGLLEQTEQALRNIESALRQAEANFADIVRVTYVVPDAEEFPAVLADPAQVFRGDPSGRDDDLGGAGRSAHENRDRGDGEDQRTSSVHTLKLSRVFMPNAVLIATSAASRPRAIRTRPMRGWLLRASNVYHLPSRKASNQPAKSIGSGAAGTPMSPR